MKIIDKTPFQQENGEIDLFGRLQGTLKYGLSWYSELEAQKAAIAQLDKLIQKGFVLIRNLILPGTEIVVPIILVGPQGINVIYATHVRGFFEAKGDEWNTVSKGRSLPARVNLVSRVKLLTRAVQLYLQKQNFELHGPIEPVLIGTDPGFHVETTRPSVRVIMSDAIKQFGASLLQAKPALKSQEVFDLADRIISPHPRDEAPLPGLEGFAGPAYKPAVAADDQPFNPSDLSFAFEDGQDATGRPAGSRDGAQAQRLPRRAAKKKILGMTGGQSIVLLVIGLVECLVLAAGAYFILYYQP
jgi:hypothetical protein